MDHAKGEAHEKEEQEREEGKRRQTTDGRTTRDVTILKLGHWLRACRPVEHELIRHYITKKEKLQTRAHALGAKAVSVVWASGSGYASAPARRCASSHPGGGVHGHHASQGAGDEVRSGTA